MQSSAIERPHRTHRHRRRRRLRTLRRVLVVGIFVSSLLAALLWVLN